MRLRITFKTDTCKAQMTTNYKVVPYTSWCVTSNCLVVAVGDENTYFPLVNIEAFKEVEEDDYT